jgi:hypothetical protein
MKDSVNKALSNSFSYLEYKKLITDLLSEGKSTGNEQSEDLLNYTNLNQSRIKRLDKTIVISEDISLKLKKLNKKYIWLVISEGWCGDAAQILPILNKMTVQSDKIELRIVLRDSNDDLMNDYLTNGGKAIPKLIIIEKQSKKVCNHWGPRPEGALTLIKNYKEKFGIIDTEAKTQLQLWYLQDKGQSVQNEVIELMLELNTSV